MGGNLSGGNAKFDFQSDKLLLRSGSDNKVIFNSDTALLDGSNTGKYQGPMGVPGNQYSFDPGSSYGNITDPITSATIRSPEFIFNPTDEYLLVFYSGGCYNNYYWGGNVMLKLIFDITDPEDAEDIGGQGLFAGTNTLIRSVTLREAIGMYEATAGDYDDPPDGSSEFRTHCPGMVVIKHNNYDDDGNTIPLQGMMVRMRMQAKGNGGFSGNKTFFLKNMSMYSCAETQLLRIVDIMGTAPLTFYTASTDFTHYYGGGDYDAGGA